jgi:integrase
MSLTKVLRDTGLAARATVHGFRSAFRTWASERTSVPHAVCEMALAHRVGSDVERSYARSDLFEKRRGLMDRWAEYVTGAGGNVLQMRR